MERARVEGEIERLAVGTQAVRSEPRSRRRPGSRAPAESLTSAAGEPEEFVTVRQESTEREAATHEWAPSRIRDYHAARSEGGVSSGILRSADGRVDALIVEGTDAWSLNRGVGRIEGTARLVDTHGNVGLAGHRDGFFRALRHVRVGDQFSILTAGNRRTYEVEWIKIVDPEQVDVLDPTDYAAVTLVTCYPFYWVGHAPQRFIVRGREIPNSNRAARTSAARR
ncbi:MAG: class D sortase [Myxococcales bacterium]|nr:class D sortase [Myxococcales bacterium]